ncbi:hypothetical protein Aduo_007390 [Ancylostoma duodenale]
MSDDDYCSFNEREQATAPTLDRVGLAHLLGRPPAYTPPGQPKRSTSRINLLLGVPIAQFMLTGLLLYGGVSCELYTGGFYCSYYTNIWMPCFCLVNSLVGIIAAIIGHDVVLFAHLFMSAIAIAVGTASAVISVIDYTTIGTKEWCHKHGVFCIIADYDPERIRHIGQHYGRENFLECVWQFKIGLTIVVLLIVGAIFVVVLNLLSIVLCALRIKQWPRLSR